VHDAGQGADIAEEGGNLLIDRDVAEPEVDLLALPVRSRNRRLMISFWTV